MTARSTHRGRPVHYTGDDWVYTDTGRPTRPLRAVWRYFARLFGAP